MTHKVQGREAVIKQITDDTFCIDGGHDLLCHDGVWRHWSVCMGRNLDFHWPTEADALAFLEQHADKAVNKADAAVDMVGKVTATPVVSVLSRLSAILRHKISDSLLDGDADAPIELTNNEAREVVAILDSDGEPPHPAPAIEAAAEPTEPGVWFLDGTPWVIRVTDYGSIFGSQVGASGRLLKTTLVHNLPKGNWRRAIPAPSHTQTKGN